MRIGLVLERFDPSRGGLENWTCQFARQLLRKGHEVHVVAFGFYPEAVSDGIIPHVLDMPRSRLERAELIAARLPAFRFDLVHDMGIGWAADVIQPHAGSTKALWEHNLMRIPKWRQIRFWREKRYRELEEIERRQHGNSSAIIVPVSRMLARNFEEYDRLPAERMRVIYNGVEVDGFTPANKSRLRNTTRRQLGIADHEVVFLALAHNFLLKNVEASIRGIATLAKAGAEVRFVVAGGKKADRFVKLAEKLGIARIVSFPGLVDPLPYYAAADVFVHPTWYDPCSLVTLEASSCGLPVITSRFNGAAELMDNGAEGYVVSDPADVETLASHMKALMQAGPRRQMGEAGRAMAMRHTLEDQTDEFLDLYKEILSRKRGRQAR
jgi:UDP-glucose:(heptosyl)LPS alpha-1,3-glucosyltransferase